MVIYSNSSAAMHETKNEEQESTTEVEGSEEDLE